jgi:hypothetical protein
MSTRCQVEVIQEGMDGWKDEITLYHHTDGYPENMIPTINKAYKYKDKYESDWIKGRAGKVASLLCWADPGVFEPESGHELHGDIEYYYKLYCVNRKGGSCADKPTWEIEIYQPVDGFWDKPDKQHLNLTTKRTDLSELVKLYQSRKAIPV